MPTPASTSASPAVPTIRAARVGTAMWLALPDPDPVWLPIRLFRSPSASAGFPCQAAWRGVLGGCDKQAAGECETADGDGTGARRTAAQAALGAYGEHCFEVLNLEQEPHLLAVIAGHHVLPLPLPEAVRVATILRDDYRFEIMARLPGGLDRHWPRRLMVSYDALSAVQTATSCCLMRRTREVPS